MVEWSGDGMSGGAEEAAVEEVSVEHEFEFGIGVAQVCWVMRILSMRRGL